jgi:hypothetical protein
VQVEGEAVRVGDWEPSPTTEHVVQVLGIPAFSQVSFTVEGEASGMGATIEATSGGVGGALPNLQIEAEGELGQAYTLVPVIAPEGGVATWSALAVIDARGRYVWGSGIALPPDTWITRATRDVDGGGVLFNVLPLGAAEGGGESATSAIVAMAWDGQERWRLETAGAHHDFVQLPDGSLVWLEQALHVLEDGTEVNISFLVEGGPGRDPAVLWDPWDEFEANLGVRPEDVSLDIAALNDDLLRANGLAHDADRDQILLSVAGLDMIVAIDRVSGEIVWRLGGANPDIPYPDWMDIDLSHGVHPTEAGVMIFANESFYGAGSSVVEFGLDLEAREATTVWTHSASPLVYVYGLGGVGRLGGDTNLVIWSTAGRIELLGPEGSLLVQTAFGGGAFGYGEVLGAL